MTATPLAPTWAGCSSSSEGETSDASATGDANPSLDDGGGSDGASHSDAGDSSGGSAGGSSALDAGNDSRPLAEAGASFDSTADAISDAGSVSCDPSKFLCKRSAPTCDDGLVPSVEGICYGPCVAIEQCGCTAAAQCPDSDHYTCHLSRAHCAQYVE